MPVPGCFVECSSERWLTFVIFMIVMVFGCAVAGRKITISLSSFMNETDIILVIPGIIVALGVLFDAIFGKG